MLIMIVRMQLHVEILNRLYNRCSTRCFERLQVWPITQDFDYRIVLSFSPGSNHIQYYEFEGVEERTLAESNIASSLGQ